jgi:hypothetical protein
MTIFWGFATISKTLLYSEKDHSPKNRGTLAGLSLPLGPRSVTSVAKSDSEFLRLRRSRAKTEESF